MGEEQTPEPGEHEGDGSGNLPSGEREENGEEPLAGHSAGEEGVRLSVTPVEVDVALAGDRLNLVLRIDLGALREANSRVGAVGVVVPVPAELPQSALRRLRGW
jgi:hypothetical protein